MSERLAHAITFSSRTPKDLARAIGISVARISQLKSGTGGIKAENLFSLARATGFSPRWLAEGTGEPQETTEKDSEYVIVQHFDYELDLNPGVDPSTAKSSLVLDRRFTQSLGANESSLRWLSPAEGAMDPTVLSTDIVLIDEAQTNPNDGLIYLLRRSNGSRVIRRFVLTINSGWILRNDDNNRSFYPDEAIDDIQVLKLDIAGRVVWRGGTL